MGVRNSQLVEYEVNIERLYGFVRNDAAQPGPNAVCYMEDLRHRGTANINAGQRMHQLPVRFKSIQEHVKMPGPGRC